jgi:hypothetical protein
MIKLLKLVTASAVVLSMATGASGSGCNRQQSPGRHRAPSVANTHRQVPAPIPDTPPAPQKTFPGNVMITLRWTQTQSRTVVLFDYGAGKLHHTGKAPGGSWDAYVKPGQYVYGLVATAYPGERGRITISIFQHNNGHQICQDDNAEAGGGGQGSVDCGGVVTI